MAREQLVALTTVIWNNRTYPEHGTAYQRGQ